MHIFRKILFTKKRRVKVFIFYLLLKIEAINYYLTNFYQHRPSGLLKNANILVKKRQNDKKVLVGFEPVTLRDLRITKQRLYPLHHRGL